MATIVNDTFTDAPGTLLSAHTSDNGVGWTINTASSANNTLHITANGTIQSVTATANSPGIYLSNAVPATANYTVVGTIQLVSSSLSSVIGVIGRYSISTDSGYCAFYVAATGYGIYKRVNGSPTLLGSTYSATPATGDVIQLQMNGTTINLILNGNTVSTVTDSTFTATGYAGVLEERTGSPYGDAYGPQFTQFQVVDTSTEAIFSNGTISANTLTTTSIIPQLSTISGGTAPYSTVFSYSTSTGGTYTQIGTTVTGTNPIANASVTGLSPSTAYFFRAVTTDAEFSPATVYSPSSTTGTALTTSATPSLTAGTISSSAITATSITLQESTISGGTAPYSTVFSYATSTNGSYNNIGSAVVGNAPTSMTLTGLTPSTTYYFRATTIDSAGTPATVISPSSTTGTPIATSAVTALTAGTITANVTTTISITPQSSTISGGIAPYSTVFSYSTSTNGPYNQIGTAVTGSAPIANVAATNLNPATTYYFRAVTTDSEGTAQTITAPSSTTGTALATLALPGTIVNDTFSDTAGTLLDAHTSDNGVSWIKNTASSLPGTLHITAGKTIAPSNTSLAGYLANVTPASVNYSVIATFVLDTTRSNDIWGVVGRYSSTSVDSGYGAFYVSGTGYVLNKRVSGTPTTLASNTTAANNGDVMELMMNGSTISLIVNGTTVLTANDTTYSTGNYGGVVVVQTSPVGDSVGIQFNHFQIVDTSSEANLVTGTITAASSSSTSITPQLSTISGGTLPYSTIFSYSTTINGTYTQIGSAVVGANPIANAAATGLNPSTTYYFRAVTRDGEFSPATVYSPSSSSGTALATPAISALTPGTITGYSITQSSITPQESAITGGLTPYSTIFSYSTTANGPYTQIGTAVAGITPIANAAATGLTASTTYYFRAVTTDSESTPSTVTSPSTTTGTAVTTNGTISVNDQNTFFSPYNWYSDGTGGSSANNINVNSSYALTVNAGAYFKQAFTNTTTYVLNVDTTPESNANIASGSYPVIKYSINNKPWTTVMLTSSSSTPINLSGLTASATNYIKVIFNGTTPTIDRWNTPVNVVKITGFLLDTGGTTVSLANTPIPILSSNVLIYGDSITEDQNVVGTTAPSGCDALADYASLTADGLSCEYGVVGFGGQGWQYGGSTIGNVTYFFTPGNDTTSSWDKYYSGQSRLVNGLLYPQPTYTLVNHGTNDGLQNISAASVTSAVTGFISAFRAAAPNTPLFLIIPFGQFMASAIQSGVTLAGDSKSFTINLGANFSLGLTSFSLGATARGNDGIHPLGYTHSRAASKIVQKVTSIESTPSPRSRMI